MKKNNQKSNHPEQISYDGPNRIDKFGLVSSALSGTTGGAFIGASFGTVGSIIGSIFGGFVTWYAGYRDELKRIAKVK